MSNLTKQLLLAAGVVVLCNGAAVADGDSGDNSMSPWTGESYAAFYGHNVGDFYTRDEKRAQRVYPPAEPPIESLASTARDRRRPNPFRDDTAA